MINRDQVLAVSRVEGKRNRAQLTGPMMAAWPENRQSVYNRLISPSTRQRVMA